MSVWDKVLKYYQCDHCEKQELDGEVFYIWVATEVLLHFCGSQCAMEFWEGRLSKTRVHSSSKATMRTAIVDSNDC